ncbi:glycoside hydrolase family 2 TIM barrel-domain containing protein [Sphingomonas sp. UYP23]
MTGKLALQLGVALVALAAPMSSSAQSAPSAAADALRAAGDRAVMPLADGWRFRQDDRATGAEASAFADADWTTVSVPHSWNRVGVYGPATKGRINLPGVVNKVQGIGWYRLHFTPDARFTGKRVWLEFDAASRIASVWLNGRLLGEHKGGYSRFRLDATDALAKAGDNVLVVKTDNTKPAPGSSTADVLPLTGDFFVPGGLYRPVRLIATDPVHLDMLDAGGPGAYAHTRAITAGTAQIDLSVKLKNDGARNQPVLMRATLRDADGKAAGSVERKLALRGGAAATLEASLAIPAAHLWQGVADPYLYRLSVELLGSDGRVLDRLEQPYGIREMVIDPERGFLLNGKPYALRGIGYHQDREDKGWATAPSDVEADVRTMREMGVTSIRLTHYQHGQAIHDLADRYGLVLWDEIPLVSAWTLGPDKVATAGLRANARQQLTELVRQNQNHASVAVWGIANEVDFGNSLPIFLTGAKGSPPDPLPLLREINATAKQLDPNRPTTLATCCEGRLFAPGVDVPITAGVTDVSGANRYFGWYFGAPADLAGNLDGLRAKRPTQPLALTEYGAGGSTAIHTDNVLGGPVDSRGRSQPEEIEDWVHEQNLAVIATKPYLWATWLWAGFDFASTVRHEGDAEDINTKGLVNYDHRTRKDAYYLYKANWSAEPTVYVTGRHYQDRAYASTDVRGYSNAPSTTLSVNGVALGAKTDCPMHVCTWPNVRLREGANEVRASGAFAGKTIDDAIAWQLSADAARTWRIDSGALVAAPGAAARYGSDAFFVGGQSGTTVKPADYGKPAQPAVIAGTPDSAIVATYREGVFHYRLPVAKGRYRVTLTFVEPAAAPGERVFDVLADDRTALPGLDVAKAAGAPMTAVVRQISVTTKRDVLDLWFKPGKGKAIVSAIEVAPLAR